MREWLKTVCAIAVLGHGVTAQAAVDPGAASAPRTDFVVPAAGTYRLQKIQGTPDAILLDVSARARHLTEFTHGRVTLLTFFYTNCEDPLGCPFAYVTLSQLRARVIAQPGLADSVRFVNVSLDPLNDTPAVIRRYAEHFGSDARFEWTFLTAPSIPSLLPVLDDFGQDVSVDIDKQGRAKRLMHHMLKVFLIDREGAVREIYSLSFLQPEMMFNDIRTLAMERPPGVVQAEGADLARSAASQR